MRIGNALALAWAWALACAWAWAWSGIGRGRVHGRERMGMEPWARTCKPWKTSGADAVPEARRTTGCLLCTCTCTWPCTWPWTRTWALPTCLIRQVRQEAARDTRLRRERRARVTRRRRLEPVHAHALQRNRRAARYQVRANLISGAHTSSPIPAEGSAALRSAALRSIDERWP